jgi:hypothetical protein
MGYIFKGEFHVLILTKFVGQHFGRFFHKLIWPPCASTKICSFHVHGAIKSKSKPGTNPTIVSYDASAVKIYEQTSAF